MILSHRSQSIHALLHISQPVVTRPRVSVDPRGRDFDIIREQQYR